MQTIYSLASILSRLIGLYSTILFIRLLFTWIPTQNNSFTNFLAKICDPFLNFFRSKKTQVGRMDFSPLLAFMVLNILQSVLSMFASYGKVSIGIIAALIVKSLWQYLGSYIFVILLILIALRWFAGRRNNDPRALNFINSIEPILYKPVHFVYNIFYNGKNTSDQTIVLTAFFFYLVCFFIVRYGLNMLVNFLCTI